jgi:hypothetical protein
MQVATFESVHYREGRIELDECDCDVCGASAPCIAIDSSGGEHGPGCICQECVDKAFARGVE